MINLGIIASSFNSGGGGGIDADAQAFITASGITDGTQISAVNQLVLDLKSASIWTKIFALYPMVGGTASTHKWNLKDPRDDDTAFRLSFSGGWVHSSTGAKPNGVNAYADTFFNSAHQSTAYDNKHLMYYSRDTGPSGVMMGGNGNSHDILVPCYSTGDDYNSLSYLITSSSTPIGSTQAFHLSSRTNSTEIDVYNNTTKETRGQVADTNTPYATYVIGARHFVDGSIIQFSSCECAASSFGDGFTTTEENNYYTAIQNFNTTLSRNI